MSELLIQNLKFDDHGLITAVVQDDDTDEVLMVAHMNAESLAKTLQTGETWFWSRSRKELWHKGETSGATQRVVDIRLDCDGDALLVRVNPNGPACHTGERTCFFQTTGQTVRQTARQTVGNAPGPESPKSANPVERIESWPLQPAQLSQMTKLALVNVAAMDLG